MASLASLHPNRPSSTKQALSGSESIGTIGPVARSVSPGSELGPLQLERSRSGLDDKHIRLCGVLDSHRTHGGPRQDPPTHRSAHFNRPFPKNDNALSWGIFRKHPSCDGAQELPLVSGGMGG